MNRKMMKTAIVFLILALSIGSTVLASTARHSPLRQNSPLTRGGVPKRGLGRGVLSYQFPFSVPLYEEGSKGCVVSFPFSKDVDAIADGVFPLTFSFPLKIRGQGTQAGLGSGSYDYPVIPLHEGILKIKPVHCTRKLRNTSVAIKIVGSTVVTFNYVSTVPIQTSQLFSNNLSDIFIPPKTTI